jgi:hypothetical protein
MAGMIERQLVEDLFQEMQEDGVDTSKEMLWGYYFVDPDPRKLEEVIPDLEAEGFDFVEMLKASESEEQQESEEDDQESEELEPQEGYFFVLHVERAESHTVDSLTELNETLEQFANARGLQSYDGMDVSPLDDDVEG